MERAVSARKVSNLYLSFRPSILASCPTCQPDGFRRGVRVVWSGVLDRNARHIRGDGAEHVFFPHVHIFLMSATNLIR